MKARKRLSWTEYNLIQERKKAEAAKRKQKQSKRRVKEEISAGKWV
jgi:hypothetical protein